jgi:hypothetical protein
MVKNNKIFFNPWDTIRESNPQEILDRHEKVTLVPFLIMAGALDDNVLPEIQESSSLRTGRPAATSNFRSSKARSTSGSPMRGRKPTGRGRWSRRSSRVN